MKIKPKISYILKCLIALFSLLGVIYGTYTAQSDGYKQPYHRLMYFTTQSNLWIAAISLALVIFPFIEVKEDKWKQRFYLIRYLFTVSITITGIVFCCFLGPFADPSYNAWSIYSINAHALVPALAIADFFIDQTPYFLKKRHILYSAIPPLIYFAIVIPMCVMGIDFGRGQPFPYFFLNFSSPAGIFGVSKLTLLNLGSFYWMSIFTLITLGVGLLYYCTSPTRKKRAD